MKHHLIDKLEQYYALGGGIITQATLQQMEASGLSFRGAKVQDSKAKLVKAILRLMGQLNLTRSWPATSGVCN